MRTPLTAAFLLCLLLSACVSATRAGNSPDFPATPIASAVLATDSANEHSHHHAENSVVTLQRPTGGGRWATDAPLRQGMERIHGAMIDALPAFEKGELSAVASTTLANEVTTQVQFLIANCKLEAAADAQLHIVIGQMLGAADALAKDPSSTDGLPRLQQTLNLYADYFAHPNLHD